MIKGSHHTTESIEKSRASHSGANNWWFGKKRPKQSAAMKGNRLRAGSHHSEETRQKMSSSREGSGNSHWKGGKKISSYGYVLILKPGHTRVDFHNYVFEHVLVAEQLLGRSLKSGETVHHINGIKNDNRPENLKIFGSLGEHTSFHHTKGRLNDRIEY